MTETEALCLHGIWHLLGRQLPQSRQIYKTIVEISRP